MACPEIPFEIRGRGIGRGPGEIWWRRWATVRESDWGDEPRVEVREGRRESEFGGIEDAKRCGAGDGVEGGPEDVDDE